MFFLALIIAKHFGCRYKHFYPLILFTYCYFGGFAAQFSQSRFSILALLLLVLLLSNQLSSPLLSAWQANGEWQILASVTMFAYLAWCKDRGLCSIHFFLSVN